MGQVTRHAEVCEAQLVAGNDDHAGERDIQRVVME
jgi:hypothetical protein